MPVSRQNTDSNLNYEKIEKAPEMEYYPISAAQKRMVILQQLNFDTINYNMPQMFEFGEPLDKEELFEIFDIIVERQESFRTAFITIDSIPMQKIYDSVDLRIDEIEIEESSLHEEYNRFIRPFDLSKPPLLRLRIVNTHNKKRHFLFLDMHHIIGDGKSDTILRNEIDALITGQELSPVELHYKDYAYWQSSEKQQKLIAKQKDYWLKNYSGELPVLDLPLDFPRPEVQSLEGAKVEIILNPIITAGLKNIAVKSKTTLYMVICTIYSILLSKLSNQDDFIIGIALQGRKHPALEQIIGMFINTMPLWVKPKADKSFNELMLEIKKLSIDIFENQDYQFEDLIEAISYKRDPARHPIFDVVLNILNVGDFNVEVPISEVNDKGPYNHLYGTSKFDLHFALIDLGENLRLELEYCNKIFKASTIDMIIKDFLNIGRQIVKDSDIAIKDITLTNNFAEINSNLFKDDEDDFNF